MSFTITLAQFVNDANTAVILSTVEEGNVLISQKDRPELWDAYIRSGIATLPFIPEDIDATGDAELERGFNSTGLQAALIRVMLSEINILRQSAGLQPRTVNQLLAALKARRKA